jgi:hypothetical protein
MRLPGGPPGTDIGHQHAVPGKPDRGQHPVHQLTGAAGERRTVAVVVRVGHRADHHDAGCGIAAGEDGGPCAVLQIAAVEGFERRLQFGKRAGAFCGKAGCRHGFAIGHRDHGGRRGGRRRAARRGGAAR